MRKCMLVAALVCGACGGGSSTTGSASVNGTIAGQTMVARDAVSNVLKRSGSTQAMAGIVIADVANVCASEAADAGQPKGAKAILFLVGTRINSQLAAPTENGAYVVYPGSADPSGKVAAVQYIATGPAGETVAEREGTAGAITLTRIESSGYSGSFDVTFEDASHITGSFNSATCSAMTMGGRPAVQVGWTID